MHYYQFNIGDYRRDTSHLTPLEHYIYRELIDTYYLSELPIPKETQSVIRRLRLGFDSVNLLENVLKDFFSEHDDGWHHKRIFGEIEKFHRSVAKNRENGRNGGRPKKENNPKKPSGLFSQTQTEPNSNPSERQPRTNNQQTNKPTNQEGEKLAPIATPAGLICKELISAGIPSCNSSHPTFLKLIEAGATQEEFYQAALAAVANDKASFAYVVAVVKGQRENAAKAVLHNGAMPAKQQSGYATNMDRTRQQIFGSDEDVFGKQIFSKGELENGNIIDVE